MQRFPKEFDCRGVVFSGGELQRLAIARAYAKNAPILILDEPSSALDPVAEAEILDLMFSMGHEKTLLLISHRLDNLKRADRILVMDDGVLVESGSHEKLLKQNGAYAHMVQEAAKYK